jgi:hypothetical protein
VPCTKFYISELLWDRLHFSVFLFTKFLKKKTIETSATKKPFVLKIRRALIVLNFFKLIKFLRVRSVIYFFLNKRSRFLISLVNRIWQPQFHNFIKKSAIACLNAYMRITGDAFIYMRGLVLIFFIDASFTDDEPL